MWYVFEMRESPLSFCFPNFLPFRWILLPRRYFDLTEYMTINQLAIESSSALFCFLKETFAMLDYSNDWSKLKPNMPLL